MINTTEQLFDEIDRHFLTPSKLEYSVVFTQTQRQVEGWFKGELLYLFSSLRRQGQLLNWESEAYLPDGGKKKSDFKVTLSNLPVYLELKTLYTGKQGASLIDLGIYFYKDMVGIWPDVQKLASVKIGQGFCILFIYPSPNPERLQQTLRTFGNRINPIVLKESSHAGKYPPSLYIAKLEVVSRI